MKNPLGSLRKKLVRLRAFPQLTRHDGATFLLDPANWIDNRILARVPYEREQLAFVAGLIDRHKLSHVVDVGANFGLYSVLLARHPGIVAVDSFEPVRRNYNQLCANIFANRLDALITPHRLALGADEGEALIHIDPTSTGVSRLDIGSTRRKSDAFREEETIVIRRGDDVLPLSGKRLFIKIDVEGHTLAALAGMARLLADNSGAIQVEIEHDGAEISRILADKGWSPLKQIGGDAYFEKAT